VSVAVTLAWGLAMAATGGTAYLGAAACAVRRFAALPAPPSGPRPPVTVLKPLCGDEPGLLDNLRSFAQQDYPTFQLVFGVRDAADPALAAVETLRAEYPEADIAVVVDATRAGINLKVANLLNMMPFARHDLIVIADSDARARPGYLQTVAATLARPGVGLVTCLYVGRPQGGLWSRLLAMGMNHAFVPSALVARALGRADGCFGATMALERGTLGAIGGLGILADKLADDYALGEAVREQGLAIAVSPLPVDVTAHEPGLGSLFRHELRWQRTVATVAPFAHAASIVTQPVALASAATLCDPSVGLPVLAASALVRLWEVRAEERTLGLEPAPPWLIALRDLLSLAEYLAAACGRSVTWRGRHFRVDRDGTLVEKTVP
jgi:ceramide glucosyltransferase